MFNPSRRGFLSDLSNHPRIDGMPKPNTPLKKPYQPASPATIMPPNHDNKPVFVDSSFFAPGQHPSFEQQVSMAKQISASLSDSRNRNSRGQSMYEKRRKKSPKWVHQEGTLSSQTSKDEEIEDDNQEELTQGSAPVTLEDLQPSIVSPKNRPLLKLVMNPQGGVVDLQALKAQGFVFDAETGLSPEICSELVKDLHEANGIGGQIFAKRKKRSEKWIVDDLHPEQSKPGDRPTTVVPKPGVASKPKPQPPMSQIVHRPMPVSPVNLGDLCSAPRTPQFPTGGVYSPRLPQGWGMQRTPLFDTPPEFPILVEPEPLPEIEPEPMPELEPEPELYMDYHEPPPAATLVDTIEESIRLMEEKRKQRHAATNYNTAARGWGGMGFYYRPVTFQDESPGHH